MKRFYPRILSLLLVITLLSSLFPLSARAESEMLTADREELSAGDLLTLTLHQTDSVPVCTTVSYRLWFDSALFQLESNECGEVCPTLRLSALKTVGGKSCYDISMVDPESRGMALQPGELYTLRFRAAGDVPAGTEADFRLELRSRLDGEMKSILPEKNRETLRVRFKASEQYRISLRGDRECLVGEGVLTEVLVSHPAPGTDSFASLDMSLTYDPAILKLETETLEDGRLYESEKGKLRILLYGPVRSCSTENAAFSLRFTAIAPGSTEIRCTEACADSAEYAAGRDAPPADISAAVLSCTVLRSDREYTVTLPDIYTGAASVKDGADYIFYPGDSNYDYELPKAEIDGESVPVYPTEDGGYRIEKVSGELTVTGSRSGKTYSVTLYGDGREDVTTPSKAEYHRDFVVTLHAEEGYTYGFEATANGESVPVEQRGESYVIPGSFVTGAIRLTVSKTAGGQEGGDYSVTYSGTGVGDVRAENGTDSAPTTAKAGEDFSFAIAKKSGYTYSVTISCKGKGVTPLVNGAVYTVPGSYVVGNLLIKVARSGGSTGGGGGGGTGGSTGGSVKVTVTGEGADYISCAETAVKNRDFTFKLTPPEGEEFEPVVMVGGSVVELTVRGNGSYVIPASAVKGPITIAVSRPGVSTPVLTEYLKLRDKESIYCISVSGSAGDGRIYSLDDQVFAFDETHSRHVFLFRSSEKPEKLRERLEELSSGVGNRESIHAAGDANGSGRMDINDAQFIYNTYLLREELKEDELQRLLSLDVNGDGVLDVEDAVVVMTAIKEARE